MYFFDLDGTLLDSNGIWLSIDIEFLQRRGVSPVPADYTDYVTHHSYPDAARYTRERFALEESPEEIMEEWRRMAETAYGERLGLKSGVEEVLELLYFDGQPMAVLTSCMPDLCQLALRHHGIDRYFTHILTTAELAGDKHSPQFYQKAMEHCGVTPEESTFFDDSPVYCAAARAAGMYVVGVADNLFAHRQGEMQQICHQYLSHWGEYLGEKF